MKEVAVNVGVVQEKLSGELPGAVHDGVGNLRLISGRLKVLVAAAEGSDCSYDELSGFHVITKSTLEESVAELDRIVADFEKHYGLGEN